MLPVGGVNLTELSQRLPTSPGASLSPSTSFGSSARAGAAWSRALILCLCRREAEHPHIQPTAGLRSFSFIFAFTLHIVGQYPNSQAAHALGIYRQQLSAMKYSQMLRVPEPVQSSAVLQAHGKDKTAPHSK